MARRNSVAQTKTDGMHGRTPPAMRLILAIVVCLLSTAESFAATPEQQLQPLSTLTERLMTGDLAEVAYVANRCACLYECLGGYTEENGRDERTRAAGKEMLARAQVFRSVGLFLDRTANRKSFESILEQYKMFLEIYGRSMKEHKTLNNSMFSPLVEADTAVASKLYPTYKQLADEMRKQGGEKE